MKQQFASLARIWDTAEGTGHENLKTGIGSENALGSDFSVFAPSRINAGNVTNKINLAKYDTIIYTVYKIALAMGSCEK